MTPPDRLVPRGAASWDGLTHREVAVLRGMAHGRTNAAIGRDMALGTATVKTYADSLFRKLKARNRAHAVARAYARGILRGDPR